MMSHAPASNFSNTLLKKITLYISLLFVAIVCYLAYKFVMVGHFRYANPTTFVAHSETAANQFWLAGIVICIISWVWVNIVAVKTRQLFWFWLPFVFVMVVAITSSYQEEELFHFKKANGLWNGGFSLSYFFAAGRIILAGFVLLINYSILKKYLKKQPAQTGS